MNKLNANVAQIKIEMNKSHKAKEQNIALYKSIGALLRKGKKQPLPTELKQEATAATEEKTTLFSKDSYLELLTSNPAF